MKHLTLKAGMHQATNRCNTLLQQIALCVQSSKPVAEGGPGGGGGQCPLLLPILIIFTEATNDPASL